MQYADGVDDTDVHPTLRIWLGAVAVLHRQAAGKGLVVTSLRRPPAERPSGHSPEPGTLVTSADVRRWYLDEAQQTEPWCISLRAMFGSHLLVLLEPEWLTPQELIARGGREKVQPHIHLQLRLLDVPRVL